MLSRGDSLALFILVVSGSIGVICFFIFTIPNMIMPDNLSMDAYINIIYMNNRRWDFLHGIYFLFFGISIVCVSWICELDNIFDYLPSFWKKT